MEPLKEKAKCKHGRQRSACKGCRGSSICQHGRHRSTCKECGGSSTASVSTGGNAINVRNVEAAASASKGGGNAVVARGVEG